MYESLTHFLHLWELPIPSVDGYVVLVHQGLPTTKRGYRTLSRPKFKET